MHHYDKRVTFYLLTLAFDGNGQPITHSEHAQINPLVLVQLLIKSIQSLGGEVISSRIHDLAAPQHLQIATEQSNATE